MVSFLLCEILMDTLMSSKSFDLVTSSICNSQLACNEHATMGPLPVSSVNVIAHVVRDYISRMFESSHVSVPKNNVRVDRFNDSFQLFPFLA